MSTRTARACSRRQRLLSKTTGPVTKVAFAPIICYRRKRVAQGKGTSPPCSRRRIGAQEARGCPALGRIAEPEAIRTLCPIKGGVMQLDVRTSAAPVLACLREATGDLHRRLEARFDAVGELADPKRKPGAIARYKAFYASAHAALAPSLAEMEGLDFSFR